MLILYPALADAWLPALAEVPNPICSLGCQAATPILSSMATYKHGKSVTNIGAIAVSHTSRRPCDLLCRWLLPPPAVAGQGHIHHSRARIRS